MKRGVVWLGLVAGGCGPGEPPRAAAVPTRGAVLVDGKPAAGAVVRFHPAAGPTLPQGVVGPDGAFALSSYAAGDGAPPGDYRVTVAWVDRPAEDQTGDGASRLPPRYADPATSGLTARVEAATGGTQLPPFRLTR